MSQPQDVGSALAFLDAREASDLDALLANCAVDSKNELVCLAAATGRLVLLRHLLADAHVNPGADDNEAIVAAAENGHVDAVCALLGDSRVNPAADNSDALSAAAMHGHCEVVRALLSDPRVDPTVAVNVAVERGHTEIVHLLLTDSRVDVGRACAALDEGPDELGACLRHTFWMLASLLCLRRDVRCPRLRPARVELLRAMLHSEQGEMRLRAEEEELLRVKRDVEEELGRQTTSLLTLMLGGVLVEDTRLRRRVVWKAAREMVGWRDDNAV